MSTLRDELFGTLQRATADAIGDPEKSAEVVSVLTSAVCATIALLAIGRLHVARGLFAGILQAMPGMLLAYCEQVRKDTSAMMRAEKPANDT